MGIGYVIFKYITLANKRTLIIDIAFIYPEPGDIRQVKCKDLCPFCCCDIHNNVYRKVKCTSFSDILYFAKMPCTSFDIQDMGYGQYGNKNVYGTLKGTR